MTNPKQHRIRIWGATIRALAFALALSIVFLLTVVATPAAHAQTFTVLHTFASGQDGAEPYAGVSIDRAGNLYGSSAYGGFTGNGCGSSGCGTVFKLTRSDSGWLLDPLYIFQGGTDGINPEAGVVIGPDGSLYSTTYSAGGGAIGTVFSLRPPAAACKSALCGWTKTSLHQFKGGGDGSGPRGALTFDASGNIYGVTEGGGYQELGTVYELTPSVSGWTESVLYNALGSPFSGVIFDNAGNLYGTTLQGGEIDYGSVYQLVHSGSGWTLNTLSSFEDDGDGNEPEGGLIMGGAGNLFGTTTGAGYGGGGTVFELTPFNGNWIMTNLYSFSGSFGPFASLTMDAAGNLYGTANKDGAYGYGSVFKLTPGNGGWTYTDLHDFTGGSDGAYPYWSGVVLDGNGNLYGTTVNGGAGTCRDGCGVVWEIRP
jgi:uncharacterized repeat protein (TIGR03803 family)